MIRTWQWFLKTYSVKRGITCTCLQTANWNLKFPEFQVQAKTHYCSVDIFLKHFYFSKYPQNQPCKIQTGEKSKHLEIFEHP